MRLVTESLHSKLSGKIVRSIGCHESSRHRGAIPGHSEVVSLFPAQIRAVSCKGKLIYFTFTSINNSSVEFYLTSHLGMSGRWVWKDEGHTAVWFDLEGDPSILYYDDMRHYGTLQFYSNRENLNKKLAEVGPDLMATALMYYQKPVVPENGDSSKITYVSGPVIPDPVTPEIWIKKFRNSRLTNKEIGIFVMEQKHLSGIGNYLKAEILYRAKIRPDRTLGSLSHADLEILYRATLETMLSSYLHKGLTIENYWDPDGNRGVFPVQVYGKTHDPHGNPVIRIEAKDSKDKRTTHWVPNVQV